MENVFQHCVDEHSENVLKSMIFDVNLKTSLNKTIMIKTGTRQVYFLHLLYSTDSDGLSVTVRNLALAKQLLDYYDLILKSSDQRNVCHFKRFENGKYITKAMLLDYVDKTNVNVEVAIQRREDNKSGTVCDLCDGTLPLYMLKCDSQHYSCMTCSKLHEKYVIRIHTSTLRVIIIC